MSTNSIQRFLNESKLLLKSFNSSSLSRVRIVTGNQSADLDSVVSSIIYAYYEKIYDPKSTVIPLMNMFKDDLRLKKDIGYVLSLKGISVDDLFFIEDYKSLTQRYDANLIDLILVDHNSTQGFLAGSDNKVIGIVDHHEDENIQSHADPRIIQKCGSCSSLVFNYWYEKLKHEKSLFAPQVQFIASPLLIDTSSMKNKVEKPDLDAFKAYQEMTVGFEYQSFYKTISEKKKDFTGLSFKDIMRKDYKQYEFETASLGTKNVGICSIGKPFKWLLKMFESSFSEDIGTYETEQNLDLILLLTSGVSEDGEFQREIGFLNKESSVDLAGPIIKKLSNEFQLKSLPISYGNVKLFQQLDIKASRKQIAPATKRAFASL